MTALCVTRPAEWWDTADDGARLAMLLCQACPARAECADLDPAPHGVIRAGIPYSDLGRPVPPCLDCGYPLLGLRFGAVVICDRCRVPSLTRWRSDIHRWNQQGVTDREAGMRLGATDEEIRTVRRSRVGRTARSRQLAGEAA